MGDGQIRNSFKTPSSLITLALSEDIRRLYDDLVWAPMILLDDMAKMDHFYVADIEASVIDTVFYVDPEAWRTCPQCALYLPKVIRVEELAEPIDIPDELAPAYNLATSGRREVSTFVMRAEFHWHSQEWMDGIKAGDASMVQECINGHFSNRSHALWDISLGCFTDWNNEVWPCPLATPELAEAAKP
ncbi:predicted protein [Cyanophage PSS2]|uniref:hypothetical protein n=1 Tax=Cyanophage PSS2 TaxID=658401 RepID=UPI0001B03FEB|nr:hypothetical protein PSS2_gp022 [Cyanophage PSS2]ACT65584.1 hypothetical protein [Cyanophage PSS2]ACY75726.1 predicted protein [Cyanophage PSS2]